MKQTYNLSWDVIENNATSLQQPILLFGSSTVTLSGRKIYIGLHSSHDSCMARLV
jgi:hypothetical protein